MKRIRFKEIALMSYSGVARRINLNSNLVIVAGGNESGKSSILKTLYHTLGASVYSFAQRWDEANVISLLKFTIDGANFKAVRMASDVYVFNPDGTPSCTIDNTLETHNAIIKNTKIAIITKAITSFFSARNFNFIKSSP